MTHRFSVLRISLATLSLFAFTFATARAEHEGKIQILLLGDSSTAGGMPRVVAPKEPQFEDMLRLLLAAEADLPPTTVINLGLSGEFIRALIDSARYEKLASKLPGLDYIFIRYGLNDDSKRENFEANFPKDYHELLAKLRTDHPQAMLIPMTVIPFADEKTSTKINSLIRAVASEEKLTLFDIYPPYATALKRGPDMLNYRAYPLSKIPDNLRSIAQPKNVNGRPTESARKEWGGLRGMRGRRVCRVVRAFSAFRGPLGTLRVQATAESYRYLGT